MGRFLPVVLFISLAAAGSARAADFVLEDVTVRHGDLLLVMPRVEFTDTNVTQEEARGLFDAQDPQEAASALEKLKAAKIFVPRVEGASGLARFTLNSVEVDEIAADRAARAFYGGGSLRLQNDRWRVDADIHPQSFEDLDMRGLFGPNGVDFSALRAGRAVWSGFSAEVSLSAQGAAPQTWRVALDSLQQKASFTNGVETRGEAELDRLTLQPAPGSPGANALSSVGLETLEFSLSFVRTYDPATRKLSITQCKLTGVNLGELDVTADFAGVPPTFLTAGAKDRLVILHDAQLSKATAGFTDKGLLNKALALASVRNGVPPENLRRQWAAAASIGLPMALRGVPASLELAQAASKFILDPKDIHLDLSAAAEPVPLGAMRAMQANDLWSKLKLVTKSD